MIDMLISTQITEIHRIQSYLTQKIIKQLECCNVKLCIDMLEIIHWGRSKLFQWFPCIKSKGKEE